MRLITCTYNSRTLIGELDGDSLRVASLPDGGGMRTLIRRGISPVRGYERVPLASVRIKAPVTPSKIIGIGRNYADHAAETGSALPSAPLIFAKFPSSIIAPGDAITWRESITTEVDWEGELAVVIGKTARDVSPENAYHHIFGYTIANDITARDLQGRIDAQWTRGKSLDTFCPIGPAIVTRDAIADPHDLRIVTTVNDETVQDGSTADMIFKVPDLVAYCSRMFTLEPGDLLLTGTPSGVGVGMTPPRFLKDGDRVSVTIDGIGTLTNTCRVLPD